MQKYKTYNFPPNPQSLIPLTDKCPDWRVGGGGGETHSPYYLILQ